MQATNSKEKKKKERLTHDTGDDVYSEQPVGVLMCDNLDHTVRVHVGLAPAVRRHRETADLPRNTSKEAANKL